MPSPLSAFTATTDPRGYGGLVILDWEYPETLPANWKLFIFKRQTAQVSDAEITAYFNGQYDDAKLKQLGIFIFRDLPSKTSFTTIKDFGVKNDTAYYYRALLRDESDNSLSTKKNANATPTTNFYLKVVDGKDIVARAVEKTLQALKNAGGSRPEIEKDIRVFKSHSERKTEDNFFVVTRVSGQNIAPTINSVIAETTDGMIRGTVDYEVIQLEWIAIGVGERRDKYTNVMKATRPILEHFIMQLSDGAVLGIQTVMMGDSDIAYGQEGAPALRGVMNVVLSLEQMIQFGRADTADWNAIDSTYVFLDQDVFPDVLLEGFGDTPFGEEEFGE